MRLSHSIVLWLVLAVCAAVEASALDVSKLDPKKLTVCSITINSDDEIKTFKSRLSPRDFQFIELTSKKNAAGGKSQGDDDWFGEACSSGVQCDLLVVSGHFAGTFFGKSGLSLSLESIEKHSCSQSCAGLLEHPREVFLFGCNTLATKEKDDRTPEQYRQVLIQDGIDAETAERVVESRYGLIGDSNRARMRRVFDGVPHLYGFASVGPLGATSKGFIDQYLQQKGDYARYLEKDAATALVSDVEKYNRGGARGYWNEELQRNMSKTSFFQCSGIAPDDPDYEAKSKLCFLYDDKNPGADKLRAIYDIVRSGDFFPYLPAIQDFFRANAQNFSDEEKEIVDRIKSVASFKAAVESLASKPEMPAMQMELIELQSNVGWLSSSEYLDRIRQAVKNLLAPPMTNEKSDVLCAFNQRKWGQFASLKLTLKDFDPHVFDSPDGLLAVGCTNTSDPEVQQKVISLLGSKNPDLRTYALYSLSSMPASDAKTVDAALPYLKTVAKKDMLLAYVATLGVPDEKVVATMVKLMEDRAFDVRNLATEYLGTIHCTAPEFTSALIKQTHSKEPFDRQTAFSFLVDQVPWSAGTRKAVIAAMKDPAEIVRTTISMGLKKELLRAPDTGLLIEYAKMLKDSKESIRQEVRSVMNAAKPTDPEVIEAIKSADPDFELTWLAPAVVK